MRCAWSRVSSSAKPLSNSASESANLPCLASATPTLKWVTADLGFSRSDFL